MYRLKIRLEVYFIIFNLFISLLIPTKISAATYNPKYDLNFDNQINLLDVIFLINVIFDIPNPSPNSTPTPKPSPKPTQIAIEWWKPTPDKPINWHWQLSQDFDPDRDMLPNKTVYDIDGEKATAADVAKIRQNAKTKYGIDNVIVICYFDAGVWENYRSDAGKFPGSASKGIAYTGDPQYANINLIGSKDVGWEGSFWMDVRRTDILRPLMEARIKSWCKDKGFDAIEPDETEVWSNNNGFSITKAQNNSYNIMIAELAHKYNLSVGLKGNTTEAGELVQYFDWTLNEECWQYNECGLQNGTNVGAFIKAGKAAFNIEYSANPNCTQSNLYHLNSAKRDLDLMGPTSKSYSYIPCIPDSQNNW